MDFQIIREKSLASASNLGYPVNLELPLLSTDLKLRTEDEIIGRSLALHVVIACSYGYDKGSAIQWLIQEDCIDYLSESERDFLEDNKKNDNVNFQFQVEALNAFAWALGFVKAIAFDSVCDNRLVKCFPDLKNNESSTRYREKAKLRSINQIIPVSDLAYCLHWALVDSSLNDKELSVYIDSHVIIERRRALEWMLGTDDWDEISLDT